MIGRLKIRKPISISHIKRALIRDIQQNFSAENRLTIIKCEVRLNRQMIQKISLLRRIFKYLCGSFLSDVTF